MSTNASKNSYNEIPYPSLPYTQSHPNYLAVVATLLGLEPPPITNCSVLELGCAGGGNLIPMAYTLPDSNFTGIDYAAAHVKQGQAAIETLELTNIQLKQMDILDVQPDFGEFDYIIAHGVYSWVAPDVRDKVLEICRNNLTANGIAYISYNTYPGWGMLKTIREAMMYHGRDASTLQERIEEARTIVDFLTESVPAETNVYGAFLQMYSDSNLKKRTENYQDDGAYLLHDELSEFNEPVYFHQFVEHANRHNLQYVGDAQFSTMMPNKFPPEVGANLEKLAKSIIDFEQYLDFLNNRTFRRSLLCQQAVKPNRKLNPGRLVNMHIASAAKAVTAKPDITGNAVEPFQSADDATLTTDHPVTKAAMIYLESIWPKSVPFATLLDKARALLADEGTQISVSIEDITRDAEVLATNILMAYSYSPNLMELTIHPPKFRLKVTDYPVVNQLVRWQVQQEQPKLTNQRHERVSATLFDRLIIPYLDGLHNREQILDAIEKQVEQDTLTLELKTSSLADALEQCLTKLAQQALLIA